MAYDIIPRNNGTYQVRIRLPQLLALTGKATYHETFDTRAEAKRQGERLHAQILAGLVPQPVVLQGIALATILDKYLDERVPELRGAAAEGSRARFLRERLGNLRLEEITIKFLEEYKRNRLGQSVGESRKKASAVRPTRYLDNLRGKGKREPDAGRTLSPQTVRHELSVLRRALKHYAYKEQIDVSLHPVMTVKLPPKSPELFRAISDEQIEQIAAHSDSELLGPAMEFMVETAMLRGELTSLRWEDCHLERGYVVLHDTKGPTEAKRESRAVPLTPRALELLRSRQPEKKVGLVWPITADGLTKAFGRAKERAGIAGVRFYDSRHEGTTRFFDQGLNTMEVAAITGHKELRTLKRYTHLSAERLAKKLRSNTRRDSSPLQENEHCVSVSPAPVRPQGGAQLISLVEFREKRAGQKATR